MGSAFGSSGSSFVPAVAEDFSVCCTVAEQQLCYQPLWALLQTSVLQQNVGAGSAVSTAMRAALWNGDVAEGGWGPVYSACVHSSIRKANQGMKSPSRRRWRQSKNVAFAHFCSSSSAYFEG